MLYVNLWILIATILISSCAGRLKKTSIKKEDKIAELLLKEGGLTPVNQYYENSVVTNSDYLKKFESRRKEKNLTNSLKLSGGDQDLINHWIHYYSVKDRDRFQRMLNRGEVYREIVQRILVESGLPADLYYLALIESGFVTGARSHASAKGVWQFMKGTGKQYGLFISPLVDERDDPVRATKAAAKYLRKLYSAYESWELAFAAYNAGEYRVLTSIMRGETRDYWKLAEKKLIPRETRNYVPKIIAAMKIARRLDRYGFKLNSNRDLALYPKLKLYQVKSPVSVTSIAKKMGITNKEVLKYNPHLQNGMTPLKTSTYGIWFPDVNSSEIQGILGSIRREYRKTKRIASKVPKGVYKVRSGDTLSGIARRLKVKTSHLRNINNIKSNKIFVGQRLKYWRVNHAKTMFNSNIYNVKKGDTLSVISKRFNIRMSNLKKYNNLKSNNLYIGQKISLGPSRNDKTHVVKRGENLILIARKYGVNLSEIKRKNNLKNNKIFPGQKLNI